ncbi:HET-domain-containing protein, partial [Thozetella sp. PMI_491]
MWLINTSTLALKQFHGDKTPFYAILSHTWTDEEISFQEFEQTANSTDATVLAKAGYRKIVATCEQAKKDGHRYAWIDTCCIDKSSSAELTEAINSMFEWYRRSLVCYVYLDDFVPSPENTDTDAWKDELETHLRQCRWFTRGWCLQELIAPRNMRFFNRAWQEIGTKSALRQLLSDIAGVPSSGLGRYSSKAIREFPIATRMSWIAHRRTTRVEDMSYSLLGILDVNMPMLYGEGKKAFLRLQEEIIRKYNDLSILAW